MCTVTFTPRKQGYALAMNRDEKLTRVAGLPPSRKMVHGREVLAPSEPGGGTWIALNGGGTTLAIINWYAIAATVHFAPVSRGRVVSATCTSSTSKLVQQTLAQLPLACINPFRLIAIFPAAHEVVEWRWNLRKLTQKRHTWQTQQWVSSGFDENLSQRIRGETFRQALRQKSAGSRAWLRRLHCSHLPVPGPFSICMHREDARTVSYTEVVVSKSDAAMSHCIGPPCKCRNEYLTVKTNLRAM